MEEALENSNIAPCTNTLRLVLPHTAALPHSRKTPNSSRNRALLHGHVFGSSTKPAFAGLLSMYLRVSNSYSLSRM